MVAVRNLSFVGFMRYLVDHKIFVVISDYDPVSPQKSRKGEVAVSGTRFGVADRIVAHRELLNFGILFRDEAVISIDNNPRRKWRNFHQIRDGKLVRQTIEVRLTGAQRLELEERGVRFIESSPSDTVLLGVDQSSFVWLTDPSLVGRIYFKNGEYLAHKRTVAYCDEKLEWLKLERARLKNQIVWSSYPLWIRRGIDKLDDFEYIYGPAVAGTFTAWIWELDEDRPRTDFTAYPDRALAYASYQQVVAERRNILFHIRPKSMAVVREYELAAWEHKGRLSQNGWSQVTIKRTTWSQRNLGTEVRLRRRSCSKIVSVRDGYEEPKISIAT